MPQTALTHIPSPVLNVIRECRTQLSALREVLLEREEEAAALRDRLRAFESRYLAQIGTLYAKLDELEAQIAEHEVLLYKSDDARSRAEAARQRADDTRAATQGDSAADELPTPTPALKTLFREVARRIHPDFALDDEDARHRTRLMAKANQAYAHGDSETLTRLLDELLEEDASSSNGGSEAELERLLRQVQHAQRDIAALDLEIAELPSGDIAQLKTDADAALLEGRDLLAELAGTLNERIADAEHRLAFVQRQVHALDR